MTKKPLPAPVYGVSITYSPVNQAYVIAWHSSLLRVISDRDEAIAYFNSITDTKGE